MKLLIDGFGWSFGIFFLFSFFSLLFFKEATKCCVVHFGKMVLAFFSGLTAVSALCVAVCLLLVLIFLVWPFKMFVTVLLFYAFFQWTRRNLWGRL